MKLINVGSLIRVQAWEKMAGFNKHRATFIRDLNEQKYIMQNLDPIKTSLLLIYNIEKKNLPGVTAEM